MKKDELNTLKKKSKSELIKILDEKKIDLLKSRAEIKAGKEKNLKKVRNMRRYIAQVKTILRLQELVEDSKSGKEDKK